MEAGGGGQTPVSPKLFLQDGEGADFDRKLLHFNVRLGCFQLDLILHILDQRVRPV